MKKSFFTNISYFAWLPDTAIHVAFSVQNSPGLAQGSSADKTRGEVRLWLGDLGVGEGEVHTRELWSGSRRQPVLWGRCYSCSFISAAQSWSPHRCSWLRVCRARTQFPQRSSSLSLACLLGACPASWEEPGRAFSCPNPSSFIYMHVSTAITVSEPHYKQVLMLYWVRANVNL